MCKQASFVCLLSLSAYDKTVRLVVRAPQLRSTDRLCVVGKPKAMGAWDVFEALPMYEHNYNEWIVDLNVETFGKRRVGISSLRHKTLPIGTMPYGKAA